MKRVLTCDCGRIFQGSDERTLLTTAREHALRDHGLSISTEQLLALSRPVLPPDEERSDGGGAIEAP